MNKKSFVLLAAAMTGVTAVAVGAVAVSGANQMSKYSVGTNATSRTITIDSSCINPDNVIEDEGYYYYELHAKTAVYNEDFVNDLENSYFWANSYRAGVDGYIFELTCDGAYDYECSLLCEFVFDCDAPITDISVQLDVDGESFGFNLDSGTSMKYVDTFTRNGKTVVQLSFANAYGEKVIGWKNLTITYNY